MSFATKYLLQNITTKVEKTKPITAQRVCVLDNNVNKTAGNNRDQSNKNLKSKIFWGILFVFIAGFSIWAVIAQSKDFSFADFVSYIADSFNIYLVLALLSSFGFLFFEGLAVICICKALGYKRGIKHGLVYATADTYFSAITPSATGGQPASAFFMKKSGIPLSVSTVALIINVIMYTLSVIFFGIFSFILDSSVFTSFDALSRILIIVGVCTQITFIVFLLLILNKAGIIYRVGCAIIDFLGKIKLIRKREAKKEKLLAYIDSYRACANAVKGKTKMLVCAFFLNLIQRACIMAVLIFSYLATGGSADDIAAVWAIQGLVTLGANSVPIPGSMGVVDYVLLDGLNNFMDESSAVYLELLSRGISFYICVLASGVVTLIAYLVIRFRRKKREEIEKADG